MNLDKPAAVNMERRLIFSKPEQSCERKQGSLYFISILQPVRSSPFWLELKSSPTVTKSCLFPIDLTATTTKSDAVDNTLSLLYIPSCSHPPLVHDGAFLNPRLIPARAVRVSPNQCHPIFTQSHARVSGTRRRRGGSTGSSSSMH
jgi:hypothetical protein